MVQNINLRNIKICQNHDYCYVEMTKNDNKILKNNHGEKSMKVLFFVYADVESLPKKLNTFLDNTEKSSTTKVNKHTVSVIYC